MSIAVERIARIAEEVGFDPKAIRFLSPRAYGRPEVMVTLWSLGSRSAEADDGAMFFNGTTVWGPDGRGGYDTAPQWSERAAHDEDAVRLELTWAAQALWRLPQDHPRRQAARVRWGVVPKGTVR